jgi:hypothetical protein
MGRTITEPAAQPGQHGNASFSGWPPLVRSAKGAARTAKPCQEPIAPNSVLREFLKS